MPEKSNSIAVSKQPYLQETVQRRDKTKPTSTEMNELMGCDEMKRLQRR